MSAFVISAGLLLLIALAALVLPLSRKSSGQTVVERNEANLQVLRDQLAELDADLRNGTLPHEQYESARAELERRVLDESQKGGTDSGRGQVGRRWLAPALIGLLVPVASVVLYAHLGNTDGLDVQDYLQQQAHNITGQDVEQMIRQLEQHLDDNPDDVEGWAMLGRSRWVMQQFDLSAQAWERAARLRPNDPDVLTNYAEALALTAQGSLAGEPTRLLSRALEMQPHHPKALALSGSSAFGRGDYKLAIEYWQRLLAISADDQELSAALETGIAEATARLGQAADEGQELAAAVEPTTAVEGDVILSPQLSQAVNPDDVVFIFARAATGPGMPLAVARVKVGELPYQFRLDDSMAITPERKISDFEQLVVGARVSESGGATRASGDLEGFSATVAAGASNVRVVIDQRVP